MTSESTRKTEKTVDYVLLGSHCGGFPDNNLRFRTDAVDRREYAKEFLRGCDDEGVYRQGRFPDTVSAVIFGEEKPGKHSGWTKEDTYNMPFRECKSLGFPDRIRVQEIVEVLE